MSPVITAEDAYAVCEGIADARTHATARTAYAEGYRAAAEHISAAIRARAGELPPYRSSIRRFVRSEAEARTFARVIAAAICVVEATGEQTDAADAVRSLVASFFSDDELPPQLRKRIGSRRPGSPPSGPVRRPRAAVPPDARARTGTGELAPPLAAAVRAGLVNCVAAEERRRVRTVRT